MQGEAKRRVVMAGVIIAGVTVGTLIAKALDPKLAYLLYKCGCKNSDEGEL